jgi:hypothetical protein
MENEYELTFLEMAKIERERRRPAEEMKKQQDLAAANAAWEAKMQALRVAENQRKKEEEEAKRDKKEQLCFRYQTELLNGRTILWIQQSITKAVNNDRTSFILVDALLSKKLFWGDTYKKHYIDNDITFAECFFGYRKDYQETYMTKEVHTLLRRTVKQGVKIIGVEFYHSKSEVERKEIDLSSNWAYAHVANVEHIYVKLD